MNRPSPKFVAASHSASPSGGAVAPMTGTIVKVATVFMVTLNVETLNLELLEWKRRQDWQDEMFTHAFLLPFY